VIKSFADERTAEFYLLGKSKYFPSSLAGAVRRKLFQLDHAKELKDLASPPGNHPEALRGDREGQHSIRINDRYRLCFEFKGGDVHNVEIVDYH
jgi:proteic killer suppression protein